MRLFLVFLVCLFFGSLSAEMIGNVEYHLPKQKQNWKIYNEIRNDVSTTIIYVPEDSSSEDIQELFAVHANTYSTGPVDQKAIERILQQQYPNQEIKVTILKQDPQSLIYEWLVIDKGQEKAIGWSRVFSSQDETVFLNYQTKNLENKDQTRSIWLPVFEEAKATQA